MATVQGTSFGALLKQRRLAAGLLCLPQLTSYLADADTWSSASISAADRAKPKTAAFSAMRAGLVDLGMTTTRCSMCQRITT